MGNKKILGLFGVSVGVLGLLWFLSPKWKLVLEQTDAPTQKMLPSPVDNYTNVKVEVEAARIFPDAVASNPILVGQGYTKSPWAILWWGTENKLMVNIMQGSRFSPLPLISLNEYHKYKLQIEDKRVRVWVDGALVEDYLRDTRIDTSPGEPLLINYNEPTSIVFYHIKSLQIYAK